MVSLKHRFHSPKGDGTDSTLLRPSDWNSEHDIVVETQALLGAMVPGPVQELQIVPLGGTDPGQFYTKAAVDAAIAAALNLLDVTSTGDLRASLQSSKANWLLCNGQTIGQPGATANFASLLAQPLFNFFWAFNSGTWPVLGPGGVEARGVSAAADWAASKVIAIPDARGCTFGMPDLGANVTPEIITLGVKVGSSKTSLTIPNIPSHQHTLNDPINLAVRGNLGGVGGGNPMMFQPGLDPQQITGKVGGDPAADPPYSTVVPISNVQPTMGVNVFIKL